jgi:predicted nuclease of predicted toxin-antitoxin system
LSLRIYLDDCAYDKGLVRLLRQVGWEVVTPFDAGLNGQPDEVHLSCATSQGLILLTKNSRDFEKLHTRFPQHAGILSVYQDNDPTKDMNVADIVRAMQNLIATDMPIAGQFIPLNGWRYIRKFDCKS